MEAVALIRKSTNDLRSEDAVEKVLDLFARTKNNHEFLSMIKKVLMK